MLSKFTPHFSFSTQTSVGYSLEISFYIHIVIKYGKNKRGKNVCR